jgi:hypothetical protein
MDFQLALSTAALLSAIASAACAIHAKLKAESTLAMPVAESRCLAWNDAYTIGVYVAYEPDSFAPQNWPVASMRTR